MVCAWLGRRAGAFFAVACAAGNFVGMRFVGAARAVVFVASDDGTFGVAGGVGLLATGIAFLAGAFF